MAATQVLNVDLGSRSYPVIIGHGLLAGLGARVREAGLRQSSAFVLSDAQVGPLYMARVRTALEASGFSQIIAHELPAGEAGKNWEEFTRVCAALLAGFPEAGSAPLVVLLGGGVVGDLGGFAAGVFRRGVPFVQVPSTLLAAVDSSVGGKVAVNFGGVKNIMGIFNQPRLVCCDLDLLASLSARELRSGAAEVIKYGVVCSAPLFEQLEGGGIERLLALEPAMLRDLVTQCVALKAAVVEQDEFDRRGVRNVLNFGHTIGHALELSAGYVLTHGEAIAIGMIAATRLALRLGACEASLLGRLEALLTRAGLPVGFPGRLPLFEPVLRALQMDKKFRDGKNLFVLPTALGNWRQQEDVPWPMVHEIIRSVLI